MPDDSRKKLYDALTSNNFDVGSFDEFNNKMNDSTSRRKLYDAATANNFDLGEFNSFEQRVGAGDALSPDVEALKNRNLARSGLDNTGKRILPTLGQQLYGGFDQVAQSAKNMRSQNIPTAVAAGASTAMEGMGALMDLPRREAQMMAAPLRLIPGVGNTLADISAFPEEALSYGMNKIGGAVSGALEAGAGVLHAAPAQRMAAIQKYLGVNPGQAEVINRAGTEGANLGAQIGLGEAAAPALGVAGKVLEPAREKFGNFLTESAFKLPTKIKLPERSQMVETIQRHGVTPGKGSYENFRSTIDDLKAHTEALEKNANLSGQVVETKDLLSGLDPLIEKWKQSDTPSEFVDALQEYKNQVLSEHGATVSGDELLGIKRRLQEQLTPLFAKQMRINPAFKQALIDQAKHTVEIAAKKQLEDMIPGYADANAEIHKMLKVEPYVQQATNRIGNWNAFRLTDAIFAGTGAVSGALGGAESGAIGAMAGAVISRMLTSPKMHAWLGNVISPTERFAMPKGMPPAPVVRRLLSNGRPGAVEGAPAATFTGSNYDLGSQVHTGLRSAGFQSSEAARYATKAASGLPLSQAEADYIGLHSPQTLQLFRDNGLLANRGLLPQTGTHNLPGNAKALDPLAQRVPESRIRGTGDEGLDVNKWENATSATPSVTNYALPDYTGRGSTPPGSGIAPQEPPPTQPPSSQPPPVGSPSNPIPEAAHKARAAGVRGDKLNTAQKNLIRQHFPGEVDKLLGEKSPTMAPSPTSPATPSAEPPALSAVEKYVNPAKERMARKGIKGFTKAEPNPESPTGTNEMMNAGADASYEDARDALERAHAPQPMNERFKNMTREERNAMTPREKREMSIERGVQQTHRDFADGYISKNLNIDFQPSASLTRDEAFQVLEEARKQQMKNNPNPTGTGIEQSVAANQRGEAQPEEPPVDKATKEAQFKDANQIAALKYELNKTYGHSFAEMEKMSKQELLDLLAKKNKF
jgi:hypothetical protein